MSGYFLNRNSFVDIFNIHYRSVRALIALFLLTSFCKETGAQQTQLNPNDFVLYSNGTAGITLIGSSITITGGSVGARKLVQTTGNVTVNSNIHAGDRIILSNSNIIKGNITAAASQSSITDIIFSTGSSASITGNIDVKGRVSIGGGSVTGIVTIPPPISNYSGPTPSIPINIITAPQTPLLPNLTETPINLALYPLNDSIYTGDISRGPGNYGNINFSGNKKLTLNRPGVYVFNSIKMSGNANKLEFNFDNKTGNYVIFVKKNADFGKLSAFFTAGGGGSADRISFEIQGTGTTTTIPNYSFIIANGSSGGGSKWFGSVLTTKSGISIGSGTGSSTLTGTFASQTGINLQSGVTVFYSPFNYCAKPVVKATSDRPLNFIGQTTLTDSFPSPGVSRLWRAINGGVISSNDPTAQTITVTAAGSYIVTDSTSETCLTRDTVVVSAKVKDIIGAELLSIYLNYNVANPNPDLDSFFVTDNGYVTVDIFCIADTSVVRKRLTDNDNGADTVVYGLINVLPNGRSPHTLTGDIPIQNLLKLNALSDILKFCRTFYRPSTNGGITVSQGDTSMRTFLVRKGFDLDGSGVKIGVISDSYNTIDDPLTEYTDICSGIDQDLFVNNEEAGSSGTDPDLANVTVVQDFPIELTDEGRAMMEIIHDVAPGTQKYFFSGFFTAGYMAEAIDSLAKLGCKIIVDDVSYATEPMLKDGIIAKTVNRVKQDSSVLYFSSAGNFGNKSYEKIFNPVLATTNIIGFQGKYAHNFKTGDNSNPDFFQKVWLKPGRNMIVFQWSDGIYSIDDNDQDTTKYDMDIYLCPADSTNGGGLIGFNRDNIGGDPIEFIPIMVPRSNDCDVAERAYNIFIVNNTPGGNPERIKYVAYGGDLRVEEYPGGNSTIVGQAGAEGAIAVGASRFNHVPKHPLLPSTLQNITKPQIEFFSSIGGTLVNGSVTPRLKPDLVGPDGVNTSVLMGQDYPPQALDTFSNFFGTSAAAPHVAALTALLIQGRQKFLGKTEHPVDSLKLLLQFTAVDMRPASMGTNDYNFFSKTGTYDYVSGAGLVDADSAMRTFASPRPFEIKLVKPTNVIPCQDPFTLTIVGENFSLNSKILIDTNRVEPFEPDSSIKKDYSYISITRDTMTVIIDTCIGNPFIWVYTDSTTRPELIVPDGGVSNGIKLFDKSIVVQTNNVSRKYGEAVNPFPTVTVTIDDKPIEQTSYSLADLGLDNSKLDQVETIASAYTPVGSYSIKVFRTFSSTNPEDQELRDSFSYVFKSGIITIEKLPITVKPNNKTIVSGKPVGPITYTYKYENGTTVTDPVLLYKFDSSYKVYKPDNTIAIINNYPGSTGLDDDDLDNISGMVTFNALKNSRKYQVVNGYLTPLPANSTLFNIQYLVDVSAQSLLNFKTNPASAVLLPSGYPGINSRAIVGAGKLAAGQVEISTSAENPFGQMINGLLVKSVNTSVGPLAPIYTNNLLQMVDGVQITINNGDTAAIPNESLVQVANGLLVKSVNGELVTLANNVLVKLLDNTIVYQTSNALLVKSVNGTGIPVLNGLLVKSVNGVLVKSVNGADVPVEDGTLIQLANGLLVKSVNGASTLIQMANGIKLPVADGLQVVNGLLVKSVNGTDVPITSGLIGAAADGNIVQITNSFSVSQGDNEDAAVIIDSDDINVEHGFLGAMFSTDMITGLSIDDHSIIAGTLINRNLQLTYEAGIGTVIEDPACLQTHSPFKNFGSTSSNPTSLWLNMTTKVSGQLSSVGDYLLFKKGTVALNAISWTPPADYNDSIPNGKIVAVDVPLETPPVTYYDEPTNTWITEVPVNFSSTSDIFVTGKIINSINGFKKDNGNTSTVVKGAFYSNKTFSDQWTYGIAAYQPQFDYLTIDEEGQVVSINGNLYRAGTPLVNNMPLQFLVQGASGGGGQNYTGSSANFQAFTACIDPNPIPPTMRIINSSITLEADQSAPVGPGVLINPNPASGYITVSFVPVETGASKIEIFTINGRKIIEMGYGICETGNNYIKQVDVSKLINGVYVVRLWNAGKVTNKKIVIAR